MSFAEPADAPNPAMAPPSRSNASGAGSVILIVRRNSMRSRHVTYIVPGVFGIGLILGLWSYVWLIDRSVPTALAGLILAFAVILWAVLGRMQAESRRLT